MHALKRDLIFGLRSLGRAPLFTLVAVLSLALGIGANTAIFSLIDQVLLRPLPVRDPDSLVLVATHGPYVGSNSGRNVLSYPMYKDYRDQNQVFSGMLGSRGTTVSLSYEGPAEFAEAEMVTGSYFHVLGLGPAQGRVFGPADETHPGANPVVVLSYDYWQSRFRGDPAVVGRTVRVNSFPMTVVGVAETGYQGLSLGFRPKLYVPVTMKPQVSPSWDDLEDRRSRWLQVFARLKPGVSRVQAEASLRTLCKQILAEELKDPWFSRVSGYARQRMSESYAVVLPGGQGQSTMRRKLEAPLKVLLALVAIVLLIACANVSNLTVARAEGRRKEMAVRLALGAGRWRIARQLLTESLMLAAVGGALGLAVSYWSTRALLVLAPNEQARASISASPDTRTLLFALGVSVLAALLFGLFPAWQTARTDLASAMKDQAGSIAGGHGARLRESLVAAQVTLSLVLLVGSGLFVQSLRNLRQVDPGFKPTNLVQFVVDPRLNGYSKERTQDFFEALRRRLEALPGVERAAVARIGVLGNDNWSSTVTGEGYAARDGENMNPSFNSISPGYLKTLGISLKAGREFDERDHRKSPRTALVNETFARRYFGEGSPLGYRIALGAGPAVKPDMEIVGVVADTRYDSLREEIPRQVWVCHAQESIATGMVVYVRTALASQQMFKAVRGEVGNLDPGLPVYDLHTMEDQLDRSLSIERLVAYLSSAYGVLASLLAVLGLYGVTACAVSRRSREIGLRMALGAEPARVIRMVLEEALWLAGIGIGLALPLTWWLARLVRSQLYGVEPGNPLTLGLAALGLLAVAATAAAAPALRASRLDPVQVLRHE